MMSSKHLRGDINYAWPTAEIAVMGAKVRSLPYMVVDKLTLFPPQGAVAILHRDKSPEGGYIILSHVPLCKGLPILLYCTVESPIKDTLNKGHLSIKHKSQFLLYQYILTSE